jgi:signal peptidase I
MKPDAAEPQRGLNAAHWRRILQEQPLRFDVISNSMAPTFRTGDKVLIRPLNPDEPKPGQILAYSRGMLVTHRYLGNGICHGDNAPYKDKPISTDDMVGIVTAVERDGQLLSLNARRPLQITIRYAIRRARRALRALRS